MKKTQQDKPPSQPKPVATTTAHYAPFAPLI